MSLSILTTTPAMGTHRNLLTDEQILEPSAASMLDQADIPMLVPANAQPRLALNLLG